MRLRTPVRVAAAGLGLISVVVFTRCTDSNDPLGGEAASISVDRLTESFAAVATGQSPPGKTFRIVNGSSGGTVTGNTNGFIGNLAATITYEGSASGWLDATLSRQSDPADLTLTPKTTSLMPGSHRATVDISAVIANSGKPLAPQKIVVTYEVAPGPVVGISGASADFETWAGGPNPTAKAFQITNTGAAGTTLQGLTTSTGNATWLRADLSGTSGTPTLTINALSQGMTAGTYTGTVTISSTVATASKSLTVSFKVTAGPSIGVSPATPPAFSTLTGAVPAAQTLDIANTGLGELSGLSVGPITFGAGASGWLTANLSGALAPAKLTLAPQQSVATLGPGTYTATIPISSSITGVAPVNITATLVVNAGPSIALTPTSVAFDAAVGGSTPPVKDVDVTNGGGGTLSGLAVETIAYGAGATDWLTATLTTSTAPSVLHLQPSRTNLNTGTYTATVQIKSTVAGVATKTVNVSYSLRDVPIINVSPSILAFTAVTNAQLPAAQPLNVSNAGSGSLGTVSPSVSYQGTATGWLTVSAVPGGFTVRPNTTALGIAKYNATVTVASSTAGVASVVVPVTYDVTPLVPVIQLDFTSLTLSTQVGQLPNYGTVFGFVSITNSVAGTTLSGLSTTATYLQGSPPGWLTLLLNQATAPATLSVYRGVPLDGYAIGTYTAKITVASTVQGVAPRTIDVTWNVTNVPCISVAPTSLTFATTEFTDAAPQVVNVVNGCPPGTLRGLSATGGSSLVFASLGSQTAPTTLTVTPQNTLPSPRGPGIYNGSVTIFSDNGSCCPSVPAKNVPFTLTITPGVGTITISPTAPVITLPGSIQLNAAVQRSTGVSDAVTWTSSNTNVATISLSGGLVTAVAKGTVTITARSTVDTTKFGTVTLVVQ